MNITWRKISVIIILCLGSVISISVFSSIAAGNTVAQSRADWDIKPISANDLKPPECGGINLTNIVDIGAGQTGTSANDLILGTNKPDAEIRGGAGNDCILGGKGNERQKIGKDWVGGLYGEGGNDVLIGGPGNKDVCEGGPGTDTFYTCETVVQD